MHIFHLGRPAAALSLATMLIVGACSSSTTPAPVAPTPAASSAAPSASTASSASPSTAPAASGSVGGSTSGSGANAVQIKGFAFNPATITVKAGTTVTWTNADNVNHTVTDDKGAFDSGPVASGTTFSQAFKTAGTFSYHCKIHPSMTATIVVQ